MDEATPITMTLRCGVAILKIDGPGKVNCCFIYSNHYIATVGQENVLSNSMTTAVGSMMESLEKRDDVNAVLIISAKANSFIAGADVGMLEKAKSAQEARDMSRNGQQKFQAIEESRIPIVAAIMAPNERNDPLGFASESHSNVYFFENGAFTFQENGTLDDSQTLRYLEESGVQCALRLATGTLRANRRASLWKSARDYIRSRGGNHYPAPFAILKCVEAGIFQGSSVGYATESEEFGRLTQTRECRALIGLFHASTMCKKQRFGRASQIK
uniref:3-hydroxyisobutyryl-CoA hydrolase n=1 Tax=Parascaris equorum TaxID=6256 RepID=A0A914R8V0_PAREQ